MEANIQTKSMEVSIQMFWDDLEKTLSNIENRTITYEDSAFENLTKKYIQQHFVLSKDKKIKNFQWIGLEIKKDLVICYVEYPGLIYVSHCVLKNDLLMQEFSDQVNLVNLILPLQKKSFSFQKNQTQFHL